MSSRQGSFPFMAPVFEVFGSFTQEESLITSDLEEKTNVIINGRGFKGR